ncbi:MAG: protein translocase subunit SecD [Chloroflexi bacterium]|nr:MAG: protein translocase subunit SecD [Chloroflexota bacterium]
MRASGKWLLVILGVALLAAFIDGYSYIYRFTSGQGLDKPLADKPTISVPALGINWQIYVHKGLDLVGGTHLELQITNVRSGITLSEARDRALFIIENRVNAAGFSEPVVRSEGADRIIVELPGVNLKQAEDLIGKTAYLTIWKWVPGKPSATVLGQLNPTDAQKYAGYTPEWTHIDGSMITNAARSTDSTGLPDVSISLNSQGAQLFDTLTKERFSHRVAGADQPPDNKIAIFLDKNLVEDAGVESEIAGGQAIITGGFTADSATQLALQLNSGALPGSVNVISNTAVGATLGANTVRLSLLGGGLGLAIVVLFMILYYRLPGVVASLALMIYAGAVLAIFKLFGVTLTLAGLAGFVLSVGMAVDANVLIFERVKEELRSGRTLGAAMEVGVKRAWPAIRDSNISTWITCGVLAFFGAPLIKGFAITLAIGVAVSMFSAIVTTQQFLQVVAGMQAARRLSFYGVQAPPKAA